MFDDCWETEQQQGTQLAQQQLKLTQQQQQQRKVVKPRAYSPIRCLSGVGLSRPERDHYQELRKHYNRESPSPDSYDAYIEDSYNAYNQSSRDDMQPHHSGIVPRRSRSRSREERRREEPRKDYRSLRESRTSDDVDSQRRSPIRRMRYPALTFDLPEIDYPLSHLNRVASSGRNTEFSPVSPSSHNSGPSRDNSRRMQIPFGIHSAENIPVKRYPGFTY